jgi:hypothetical protein
MVRIFDYLVRYPLASEQVASVTELVFDGGNDIYLYVTNDVVDVNEFTLSSLDGVEVCVNLQALQENGLIDNFDCVKLKPLKKLASISLEPYPHRNSASLLDLPALRSLTCFDNSLDDFSVFDELKAKGVRIELHS